MRRPRHISSRRYGRLSITPAAAAALAQAGWSLNAALDCHGLRFAATWWATWTGQVHRLQGIYRSELPLQGHVLQLVTSADRQVTTITLARPGACLGLQDHSLPWQHGVATSQEKKGEPR